MRPAVVVNRPVATSVTAGVPPPSEALTAAGLYIDKKVPNLIRAAEDCGSNVNYVRAALAVLEAGFLQEQALVLAGHLPLLEAANSKRACGARFPSTMPSWLGACGTPEQRIQFGRGAGIAELWDDAISPVVSEQRSSCHERQSRRSRAGIPRRGSRQS